MDKADYIPIGEIEIGEKIRTKSGFVTTLIAKEPLPSPERVYNFEVYREHNYLVSELDISVHNYDPKKKNKKGPIHHIATNKNKKSKARGGPWTPRFQKFFDNADLNINKGIENLVEVADHKGPHPEAYHQYVYDALDAATEGLQGGTQAYKDAVIGTLNEIKIQATTKGSQVNKWLTKK